MNDTYFCNYCHRDRNHTIEHTLVTVPAPDQYGDCDQVLRLCSLCKEDHRHESPAVAFWVTHHEDGLIGVVFKPGREYEETDISYGGPCEEGYSYTHERYELHFNEVTFEWVVTLEITTDSRDCDSRYSSTRYLHARLEDLDKNRVAGAPGFKTPLWAERKNGEYRDFTAESMNY